MSSSPQQTLKQPHWQQELLESYTSLEELVRDGFISNAESNSLNGVARDYRVRIPRYYAGLIDKALGARCPIRQQAIPAASEFDVDLPDWARAISQKAFGVDLPWRADAIGDLAKLAAPRLTHRYGNRAILHLSSLCALYCRFCFRKTHLNDREKSLYDGSLDDAFHYLKEHSEIREVILTGGDPLSVTDRVLENLLRRLGEIPHLKSVRIHSRMAVTLPSRITDDLCRVLASTQLVVNVVSHFNHTAELTAPAREALARLRKSGIPLYNQSVLLHGVNDSVDALATLFQELFELGVRPFYLHHADWTPGTFEFRSSIEHGQALMRALKGRVPGPALPDYVLDIPGGAGKISLQDSKIMRLETMEDSKIAGALYQIQTPQVKDQEQSAQSVLYAEFWKLSSKQSL